MDNFINEKVSMLIKNKIHKIAVVGDSCKDVFVYGICTRLNPEAPVPIINEIYRTEYKGMAGNVHKNLTELGIESEFITHKEKIIKIRYIEEKSNYILLRCDEDPPVKRLNIDFLHDYDMVIISDYNKGFLTEDDIKKITQRNKLTFIDTKKTIGSWILDATFVKINESEYSNVLNDSNVIKALLKDDKLIITLGNKGVSFKNIIHEPKKLVNTRDVVGAGDTFLAALAGHYFLHNNIEEAVHFANLCAGQVVNKRGIAFPDEKLI
jgi:bifunctional ADP-heptose synthase (sugar kinase/adenylyltransferase)